MNELLSPEQRTPEKRGAMTAEDFKILREAMLSVTASKADGSTVEAGLSTDQQERIRAFLIEADRRAVEAHSRATADRFSLAKRLVDTLSSVSGSVSRALDVLTEKPNQLTEQAK
ncbi:MAG: hypothetical protein Q8P30_04985 [Candidatus Uhrbacteria bacterium]|nr:hypothetical protein [Candidatus Uhrbacteria bacterium]